MRVERMKELEKTTQERRTQKEGSSRGGKQKIDRRMKEGKNLLSFERSSNLLLFQQHNPYPVVTEEAVRFKIDLTVSFMGE